MYVHCMYSTRMTKIASTGLLLALPNKPFTVQLGPDTHALTHIQRNSSEYTIYKTQSVVSTLTCTIVSSLVERQTMNHQVSVATASHYHGKTKWLDSTTGFNMSYTHTQNNTHTHTHTHTILPTHMHTDTQTSVWALDLILFTRQDNNMSVQGRRITVPVRNGVTLEQEADSVSCQLSAITLTRCNQGRLSILHSQNSESIV